MLVENYYVAYVAMLIVQLQFMSLMERPIDGHMMSVFLRSFLSTISVIRHNKGLSKKNCNGKNKWPG